MKRSLFERINPVFASLHVFALALPIIALFWLHNQMAISTTLILALLWLVSLVLPVLAWWLRQQQSNALLQEASVIASGCFSNKDMGQISLAQGNDASREFVEKFNGLTAKVSASCSLFNNAAAKLAEQAHQLSSVASQIEQRMRGQLERTGDVHAAISELQQTVSVAADTAGQASALASKSESEGNSGKVVMTEAITGVMMMSGAVKEAGEIIKMLGEDSQSIGGIIEVITGVAEQTNLLALNAAIEAARAGEQGRGFAVVADEVRKLASQTQDSAQKIKTIIGQLLGHVREAGNVVAKAQDYSNKSDELMEGVTISYSEIVGYMSQISVLASNLAQATAQGSASATASTDQLSAIQATADETISMAKGLVAASMELGKMGQQLNILVSGSASAASTNDVELF